jgi:hypothetical protein
MRTAVITIVSGRRDHLVRQRAGLDGPEHHVVVAMGDGEAGRCQQLVGDSSDVIQLDVAQEGRCRLRLGHSARHPPCVDDRPRRRRRALDRSVRHSCRSSTVDQVSTTQRQRGGAYSWRSFPSGSLNGTIRPHGCSEISSEKSTPSSLRRSTSRSSSPSG